MTGAPQRVQRIAVGVIVALLLYPVANASGEEPSGGPPSTIWVEPGTVIWDRPGAHGREVARVQTLAEVPVSEVTRGWVRVTYLERSGWVARPEMGSGGSLAAPPCDQIVFDTAVRCTDLGWVWLVTDLAASETRGIESLLSDLPARYRVRYGDFSAVTGGRAWFAVLRRRDDYDAFLSQVRSQLAVDATAVASGRVAAMVFKAERDQAESILLHEGTHLINRVALGEGLPVWLEEGTAGCLGLVDDDGTVGGRTSFSPILTYHQGGWSEERIEVSHAGPRATVARVRTDAAAGELALDSLLNAGRQRFYRSDDRERNYGLSSLFTCYLAERVFPGSTGGLVAAWHQERLGAVLEDDWLPADLGTWAAELLSSHEETE